MKTLINIKVDKDIKEQAVRVAKDMAMPLSTIINAFLRNLISERRMTFSAPLKPSKKLERMLRKADNDIKNGKNLSHVFTNVDDIIAYLNK